jgi:4-hydroxy-tetrahydrodipicolinate synthase
MTELLFTEGNPSGIKAIMSVLNLCLNTLRLPLVPVSRPTLARIQKAVDEIKSTQ